MCTPLCFTVHALVSLGEGTGLRLPRLELKPLEAMSPLIFFASFILKLLRFVVTFYFSRSETLVSEHFVDHLVLKFVFRFLVYYSHYFIDKPVGIFFFR